MLSSIGRAAIRRLVSSGSATAPRHISVSRIPVNSVGHGRSVFRALSTTPAQSKAAVATEIEKAPTKRATKKPAATKAPAKKAATKTTKKAATTTKATKTAKPKVAAAAKSKAKPKAKAKVKAKAKPKPKGKPRAKPIDPEKLKKKKELIEKRELRKAALFTEPKQLPTNAWTCFIVEKINGKEGSLEGRMRVLAPEFKALPASEIEVST